MKGEKGFGPVGCLPQWPGQGGIECILASLETIPSLPPPLGQGE